MKLRATLCFVLVMLVGMDVLVGRMPMVVVVHQLFRHVGEHLARGRRRAAGPLDAALLARRREEIVPGELRRVARHFQALGQRGEHEFPNAAPVPALAQRGQLADAGRVLRHGQ